MCRIFSRTRYVTKFNVMSISYALVRNSIGKFFIFLRIKRLGKYHNINLPSLKFLTFFFPFYKTILKIKNKQNRPTKVTYYFTPLPNIYISYTLDMNGG